MTSAAALLAVAAVGIAVGGCSGLQPYPTAPADPRPGETDAGPRVAICYNTLVSTVGEVQAAAQQECAPNTDATPVATDWRLQYCPLLLPARDTFVCAPKQ